MKRRDALKSVLFTSVATSLSLTGCQSSEDEIVRYAIIAGTAAVSIGTLLKDKNPSLGEQIVASANAVIASASEWQLGGGTEALLVNALNSLLNILNTIPHDTAGAVAALIPIAVAAIKSIFVLLEKKDPQIVATISPQRDVWPPATIEHKWGHTPESDFKAEWNSKAKDVPGAVILK